MLAKVLHDRTSQTILVVCYTNHALDQFLEDLLDIGIPQSSIVRLGGKATPRTADLALQKLAKSSGHRKNKGDWQEIDGLKLSSDLLSQKLDELFQQYTSFGKIPYKDLLEHLELEFVHREFFEAFRVPLSTDGMVKVGKKGKAVSEDYLLHRWLSGQDAGMYKSAPHVRSASKIWALPNVERSNLYASWAQEMMKEIVELFGSTAQDYNKCINQLDRKFTESEAMVLKDKRIIGCTTTGAAKYRADIANVNPEVLLVEEAGEILESHILTSLGAGTKQLILIGDHKSVTLPVLLSLAIGLIIALFRQLRPKVNHYLLTVEKGEGYDLNRSLFERLVLKGYPHETLLAQHRMRPEISKFVRKLTYPELIDAPKTQGRPDLRGVLNNVVFIEHSTPEDEDGLLDDRKDPSSKSSKQNKYDYRGRLLLA